MASLYFKDFCGQSYRIPLILAKYFIKLILVISVTILNAQYPSSETAMLGFLRNTFFANEYNHN